MQPALEIQQLDKKYDANAPLVISSLELAVASGEIVALLGESGSGKTTLLRLIAGLEKPTQGTLSIAGEAVADGSRSLPPEKRKVGMVFQDYALFPHLSIEKNVTYGVSGSRKQQQLRADEVLSLVGLADYKARFPHQLSGGQQQRVALARALATQPKLLLLDEPFSNLDEGLKAKVRAELKQIVKQAGTTSLFVTHDTQDALAVADRIALLHQGRLVQFGTPQQLYEQPASEFIAHYFGQVNWLDEPLKQIFSDLLVLEKGDSSSSIGLRLHQFVRTAQGVAFTVTSVSYLGSGWELVGQAEGQTLTVRLNQGSYQVGDTLTISPAGNPIVLDREAGKA